MLGNLFTPAGAKRSKNHRGGSYPNLFDAHPPFQIDGNFGATAGIAEMLLQSHSDGIELLPALPPAWPNGSVKGLLARGAFEVDMTWRHGQLVGVAIHSKAGQPCRLRYGGKSVEIETTAGGVYPFDASLQPVE